MALTAALRSTVFGKIGCSIEMPRRSVLANSSCATLVLLAAAVVGMVVATDAALQGTQGSTAKDRAALVALYDATDGANWTNNTNWKTSAPLPEWYGVQTNPSGRVTALDLRDNALNGSLPTQLGNLTYLSWLVLLNNDLTDTIPATLRKLDHLDTLDLGGNALTGDVPAWLGDLSNLRNLLLWGNELTGTIPTALRKLNKLEWLNLSGNALAGTVPTWLGDLASLRRLWLSGNELTGTIPATLRKLDHLGTLDLGGNALTGAVPAWLGDLSNLRWLSLWGNELTGTIPATLQKLDKLESLNLGDNALTGTVPAWLGDLSNLRNLLLWGNELTGTIPTALRRLDKLESLSLGWNDLTGPIPVALGSLGNLEWLSLNGNALAYPIPSELGSLGNLKRLYLGSNALTDAVPASLGNLQNLEALDISWNPVSEALPQRLTRLSRLKRLDISGTAACAPTDDPFQEWLAMREFHGELCNRAPQLGKPIPPQTLTAPATRGVSVGDYFSDPDKDELIYTAESSHVGHVAAVTSGDTVWLSPLDAGKATVTVTACDPDSLCADQTMDVTVRGASTASQTDREVLVALYNATGGDDWTDNTNWKTTASIDTWHGVTTNESGRVTRLDLWENEMTGKIPAALRGLDELENLNLGGNALTGPIPTFLGNLSGLRWLILSGNELTGPVPAELGNLRNLQQLDLGWNELTGSIPGALRNLDNLAILSLAGNNLTGRIPTWVTGFGALETLFLNTNELTGRIPAGLGRMRSLRWLSLADNDLTPGRIPAELGDLTNLESLWLYQTNRTGRIPSELGKLTNLRTLSLYGNGLTGAIPAALGGLTSLRHLYLHSNWGLSGPLPQDWQLPDLEALDLFVTRVCAPEVWQEQLETVDFLGGICGTEDNRTIDVAFVYTPPAKEAAGGTDQIEAEIDLMIAATNQAFKDSGVRSRVALVDRSEVLYEETGDSLIDIGRLIDPSDGHMDEAHDMRDRVGADLVHLIVAESDVGGRGQLPGAFGFSTWPGWAVPHELGHNLGISHDRYEINDDGGRLLPDPAYGYVNQQGFESGVPRSRWWGTIMSYSTQCEDHFLWCSDLPRYSNPRLRFNGDPIGVPYGKGASGVTGPADAAAVLNVTGPVVAAWRDRPPRADEPAEAVARARGDSVFPALGVAQPAAGQSEGLFTAAAELSARSAIAPNLSASQDAVSLRRRVVSIDFGQLEPTTAELTLNLFDDAVFTGRVEQTERTFSGGYVLSGQLDDVEMGTVTMVVNGDVVAGTVWTPEATYRISSAGGGLHAISQIDPAQRPPLGDPLPRRLREGDQRDTPRR
ncbi:MAG: hypothetical protein OXF27_12290 [Acidobacteria bacterium]|nr:hypothetical protein [Acidobacteriota bacterium]